MGVAAARIICNVLGLLYIGFIAVIFIGQSIGVPLEPELIPFYALMAVIVVGYALSWFRARLGGAIEVMGSILVIAYFLIRYGLGDWQVASLFGLPFLVIGMVNSLLRDKKSDAARG